MMSSGEIDSLSIVSPGDASCIASGSKDHAELEYNDVEKNQSALCEEVIAPSHAVESLERWNSSNTIRYRYFVTLLDMFVLGMNDAAIGALVPYLESFYALSYTIVSLIFLAPFVGYTTAAVLNNRIHMNYGQLGIAVIAPISKLIAYITAALHPPWPVIVVVLIFSGFGNGLQDSGWNAWVGNMASANELLGFLHGFYGLGATVSPLVATAMVTQGFQWYTYYYIMIGLATLEFVVGTLAFQAATGTVHRAHHPSVAGARSRTSEALTNRVTWLCAIFLLGYVGAEVSLGGWLVTFMLRVRNADPFAAGLTVTFFWLGITLGRVILGFVTGRIGEKLAIALYLLLCMALELLFWLIPSFISSAIFSALLGFFLGPLFPAAIVVATKLLPRSLHVSAIGFAAAFGGGGAAVIPFFVGAIAQAKGVQVLQPVILAFLALILMLWISLPGGMRKRGLDEAQAALVIGPGREDLEMHPVNMSFRRFKEKLTMGRGRNIDS